MEKKHIITIAGGLGSGKSTAAKATADILGYGHISTGDFMRSIANERGISLSKLTKIAESDPSIDQKLDDYNKKVGDMDNVVLDSRLGFYFIPSSFKVFLSLPPLVAAARILEDKKSNPNRVKESPYGFDTVEGILQSISVRFLSEQKRYKDLYGIENHTSPSNFDLIIDTENNSAEQVSSKIVEEYKKWLSK